MAEFHVLKLRYDASNDRITCGNISNDLKNFNLNFLKIFMLKITLYKFM